MAQFISGTPTNDVLSINSDWMSGMAHFLEPLDPYIERDKLDLKEMFGTDGAKQTTFDDKIAGLLVRTGGDVYWFNKDMFSSLGLKPPTTLDELRKNAEALRKQATEGGEPVYGYSIMAQSPLWTVSSFADLYSEAWSAGAGTIRCARAAAGKRRGPPQPASRGCDCGRGHRRRCFHHPAPQRAARQPRPSAG
jgi:ABC-type glycerol-3-phosphate transport system substrate-binding protein